MARGSFQNEIPPSRINIRYKKETGGADAQVELPLKLLVVGDYTQRADDTLLEERKPINISKDNFEAVMAAQNLQISLKAVEDHTSSTKDATMQVDLKFGSMKDFLPENIAQQVPELRRLLEVRKLLEDLKGKVVNKPGFRRELEAVLKDKTKVDELMGALDKITPLLKTEQDAKHTGGQS